jgi:hypothetical protein
MGFKEDEYARTEVRAYKEHSRSSKEQQVEEPQRRFIVEQEAARLHCYDLIGLMNDTEIWGR